MFTFNHAAKTAKNALGCIRSNSKSIRAVIVICLLATLSTGCLKRAGKPSGSASGNDVKMNNADFRVMEIDDTARVLETATNDVWTMPTEKTYEFRACLIGRATNAQLPMGQKFMVIKPNGVASESATDDQGCLNWQEKVKFNFASDSAYIRLSRRLRSMGSYKGEVPIELGVNPWHSYRDTNGKEVIDLNRSQVVNSNQIIDESNEIYLRRGLVNNDDSSSRLLIEPNIEYNLIPVRDLADGKELQLVLRLDPFIQARNLRNDLHAFDLKTGKYRVFAQLISNYVGKNKAGQHALLTPEFTPQEVIVDNSNGGILSLLINFKLQRHIDMGQVQLALKIEPMNTPYSILPFEGLYNMGSFASILGSGSATQVKGYASAGAVNLTTTSDKESEEKPESLVSKTAKMPSFNYGQFVQQASNFEDLKKEQVASDLPPVYYDMLEPRFVRIKSGETSTQRTIIYRITTTVRDSMTGEPKRFQPFTIRNTMTNKIENVQSNESGLIMWTDELSHLYYSPEQYFFPEYELKQVVSDHTLKVKIGVNPWDFGWTFGEDTRRREEFYAQMAAQKVLPPEFMIDAFRYQTIRFRYVIDEHLTLNVKKAVVMALDPLVERNTINEGRKFEPLRNGIYLVKIALVKYYIDPFQNNTRLIRMGQDEPGTDVVCPGFEGPTTDENGDGIVDETAPVAQPAQGPTLDNAGFKLETVSCNGEAAKGQYTTVIKKLLRVQAGRITTPLEFSMRDLRMMSIRSNIMVQLETIDENRLLRDNLINQKIQEQIDDYYRANTEGMSNEERNAFIAERTREHEAEAEKLQTSMAQNLEQLKQERDTQNAAFEARDQVLFDLETRLGSVAAASSEAYKSNLNLPEDQFLARMNEARGKLNDLHTRIENYWGPYEQAWKEDQLAHKANDGLMGIPMEHLSKKPSYLDYLATMQHFLDDFGVGMNVGQKDLNELEVNNYSDNPLTPLVDLNLYIEDSGLARRSFIGPCTLVENDNMSELRPTDKIDEALGTSIDNSQEIYTPLKPPADNRAFEQSAYHDSLIPFANLHVDDIIKDHINNEIQYEREMQALSQTGRFVKSFNLNYVSLTDEPLKEFRPGCTFEDGEDCTQEVHGTSQTRDQFLDLLNNVPEQDLLSRYFYVRPLNASQKLNKEISRTNSLEPLWTRTKRQFMGFLPSDDDLWMSGVAYGKGGIGNKYHHTAREFLSDNYGSNPGANVNLAAWATSETQRLNLADKAMVKNWLTHGPHNLNLLDAVKICSALTQQMSKELRAHNLIQDRGSKWAPSKKTPEEYLLEYCFSKIHYIDKETIDSGEIELNARAKDLNQASGRVIIDGLAIDRRYRVVETGAYEHKAGKNTNLNLGTAFSVGTYDDISSTASLGLSGGAAALLGLPVVGVGAWAGAVSAGIVATGPLAPLVAGAVAGTAATIGGLVVTSASSDKSKGVNLSSSTDVSMATFLVVQQAEIDIVLKEYERCLSIQFSPEMIKGMNFDLLQIVSGITDRNVKLHEALSRGFFICEGEVSKQPRKVRENYYYLTQHFTAGDMLDENNLLNHVWLLALRGERDFNAFINTLKAREVGPNGEEIPKENVNTYSLTKLADVYSRVLPSFPGFYSIQDPAPVKFPRPTN